MPAMAIEDSPTARRICWLRLAIRLAILIVAKDLAHDNFPDQENQKAIGRMNMPNDAEAKANADLLELTADIVAAYVQNDATPSLVSLT